jgi:DNA-binding NtrC family response regulator
MVKKRILVISNHVHIRVNFRLWLEEAGYQVASAATKQEALNLLGHVGYSLVIFEHRVLAPGQQRHHLVEKIQKEWPRTKLILINPAELEQNVMVNIQSNWRLNRVLHDPERSVLLNEIQYVLG